MSFADTVKITLHYIRSRLLESFMVVLGIALGVGIISSVLSLYSNYVGSMQDTLDDPRWKEIAVGPNRDNFSGFSAIQRIDPETRDSGPSVTFSLSDIAEAKAESPAVDYGYAVNWERFSLGESARFAGRRVRRIEDGREIVEDQKESGGDKTGTDLIPPNAEIEEFDGRAVTPEFFSSYNLNAEYGSLFSHTDIESELKLVVLGHTAAELLYPETPPQEIVGKKIRLNGFVYTISGIMEKQPPDAMDGRTVDRGGFTPITASQFYMFQNTLHSITFAVDDPENLDEATSQLTSFFEIKYGDKVGITNRREDFLEQRRRVVPVLTVIGLLSSMGLFIASINILNLMLARVVRRRKAIGISVAMGGSRGSIFGQYLTESLGLGFIGGIFGIGLSAVLVKLLSLMFQVNTVQGAQGPELNLTLTTVGLAVAVTLVINLIFAVYPAYKASSVDPAETLRA
ncbi:MAG: ABC transporter permease [Spirochaetia bacterium]